MRFLLLLVFLLTLPAYAGDFKGYACTKDCSGHKAGYAWAQGKGLTDKSQCGGRSNSFIEGCYAYVDELEANNPDSSSSDLETSQSPAPVYTGEVP